MPDWKRVIVGDAFPSRNFNYYRDLFLIWPFLLFTASGLANLFSVERDYHIGFKCAAVALVVLLLARERFLVILGTLGCCAFQSTLSVVVKHDWIALAASISTGVIGFLLIRSLKDYKPSYGWPRDIHILDLLISLTSLGLTVVLRSWILR